MKPHQHGPSVEGQKKRPSYASNLGQKKQEVTSQLDHIIGPRRRDDDVYMCNDVRTWATWDHHPFYVRIQEEERTESFSKGKRKKKWTGWRPKTDERNVEFRKNVMEGGEERLKNIWLLFKKLLKLPLVKWRITLKLKEKKLYRVRRRL